jgi:outer membrane receptor for ferrienterochelin and colicins
MKIYTRLSGNYKRALKLMICAICCSLFILSANAQDTTSSKQSYFDLSLEELLSVKVSIASTKPEAISSTPAIVSTYYMKELMLLGARSLADALSFIPGVVVNESTFGFTSIMIRGTEESSNTQMLFLLDGIPYMSPSHSSFSTLIVPVEAIDRIEVIRGPGSVLYGSNALIGVINVITRSQPGGQVAFTVGSNNHRNLGGAVSKDLGNDSWISMAFEHQNQDGFEGEYRYNDQSLRLPRPKEMSSALVRYGIKNLNLLFQMYQETVRGHNPPSAANPAPLSGLPQYVRQDGFLAHADYTWQLNTSSLKVYTDYNQYPLTLDLPPITLGFDNDGNDNYRWRSGAQYSVEFESVDQLSLLAGVEYERRNTGAYLSYLLSDQSTPLATIMEAGSTDELAAYLQLDYWLDKWRFVAGARVIDNEKAGSKVLPRASVVYSFTDEQSLKLLYAVGFTSPSFPQSAINIPGLIIGDPSLPAATITSIDLAYTYSTPRLFFVINAYLYYANDFIRITSNPDPNYVRIHSNVEPFSRRGFEVDLKRKFNRWSIIANASYNHEGDTELDDDPTALFVPKTVINVGATYDLNDQHTLAATVQAVSKRSTSDAYQVANLTYTYKKDTVETFLSLRNIMGEDPHNPDAGTGQPIMSLPRDYDKLNFLAGIKLYF